MSAALEPVSPVSLMSTAERDFVGRIVRAVIAVPEPSLISDAIRFFSTPERIEALEAELLKYEQAEIPVTHRLCSGVYAREITIPRGAFAIGHAHRHDCLNIVLSGRASVLIDGEVRIVTGPCVFIGKAGERKVGYIHEDATWITVHSTKETDLAKIEDELLVKSRPFSEAERLLRDGLVARRLVRPIQSDYQGVIAELGLSEQEVETRVRDESDLIGLPTEFSGSVTIGASAIDGLGVFAAREFSAGDVIAPARIGLMRTPVGRYTNHSPAPNCEMRRSGECVDTVAIQPISVGDELTVDYRTAYRIAREADQLATQNA